MSLVIGVAMIAFMFGTLFGLLIAVLVAGQRNRRGTE